MKKNISKKPQNSNNNTHRLFESPEIINMDNLSYFDDENLETLLIQLQNEREKILHAGNDPQAWEIEICYVQREMKIRTSRKVAHEKYLKYNPDAAVYDYSANME